MEVFHSQPHCLGMFSDDWSIASGYIKYLICHVTSLNCMMKVSSNFMSGSSSWYTSTLPSLIAIGIVLVEI